MRKLCVLTAVAAAFLAGDLAIAGQPRIQPVSASGDASANEASGDDASSSDDGDCGCQGGGRRGKRNADKYFNCNCNGSYKFPVPPLYTYHWPGMYSMKRMTDYHSPWRFPAIKPYTDETPVRDLSRGPGIRQASADIAADRAER